MSTLNVHIHVDQEQRLANCHMEHFDDAGASQGSGFLGEQQCYSNSERISSFALRCAEKYVRSIAESIRDSGMQVDWMRVFIDNRFPVDGVNLWFGKWKRNNWMTTSGTRVKMRELWEGLDRHLSEAHGTIEFVKPEVMCFTHWHHTSPESEPSGPSVMLEKFVTPAARIWVAGQGCW